MRFAVPFYGIIVMKRRHQRTLALIYKRPASGSIPWREIEALFVELGGEIKEREGSRVEVFWAGNVRVFHRPHPSPDTDKGAVESIRRWLDSNGVKP
jgi:HicA toxin of bacterial toxin-antitoxin,